MEWGFLTSSLPKKATRFQSGLTSGLAFLLSAICPEPRADLVSCILTRAGGALRIIRCILFPNTVIRYKPERSFRYAHEQHSRHHPGPGRRHFPDRLRQQGRTRTPGRPGCSSCRQARDHRQDRPCLSPHRPPGPHRQGQRVRRHPGHRGTKRQGPGDRRCQGQVRTHFRRRPGRPQAGHHRGPEVRRRQG